MPSIDADYRASAGIDVEHDRADRAVGHRLGMPVTVVQQDWGAQLGYDASALWSEWAADLDHRMLDVGHFMAEQAPGEIIDIITSPLARTPRAAGVAYASGDRRAQL